MSVVKRGTKQQNITHPHRSMSRVNKQLAIDKETSLSVGFNYALFWEKYFSFVTVLAMTLNYVLLFNICHSLGERMLSIYVYASHNLNSASISIISRGSVTGVHKDLTRDCFVSIRAVTCIT